ncbi:MAG: pyruvate ferredoxin oxidoreductase, partial [Candidatus Methanosuratincola sp.]
MFLEIRLHGRGGQGIVTAAEMIAEAAIVEG